MSTTARKLEIFSSYAQQTNCTIKQHTAFCFSSCSFPRINVTLQLSDICYLFSLKQLQCAQMCTLKIYVSCKLHNGIICDNINFTRRVSNISLKNDQICSYTENTKFVKITNCRHNVQTRNINKQ